MKDYVLLVGVFTCALLLLSCCDLVGGIKTETIKHCCALGENHATTNLECKDARDESLVDIEKTDQSRCLRTLDVCCKKRLRQLECDLGIKDAEKGSCASVDSERKDCCESCTMGFLAGKNDESCEPDLALGDAFVNCCEKIQSEANFTFTTPITSTTMTDSTAVPSTTTTSASSSFFDGSFAENAEIICDSDVCAHICDRISDTDYKCSCYPGYILMDDGVSCKPLRRSPKKGSRCEYNNPCDHKCIDTGTAIKCECYEGWKLAEDGQTCEDIQDALEKCPEGFLFNGTSNTCDDINECEFDLRCEASQVCENTIGSYTCKDKEIAAEPCPSGYYFNPEISECDDIDECLTDSHDCNKESQDCLNTKGNYSCIDKASKNACPPGFKKNLATSLCDDIDECMENNGSCKDGETCVNESGGHTCVPSKKTASPTIVPPVVLKPVDDASCSTGYKHNGYGCHDINECVLDPEACDSNQDCKNTPGSYTCVCKIGFMKDPKTGACVDINECQIGTHDCTEHQRCDNNPGSYVCNRIAGCGTGYTYNSGSGICEDDDECVLGTHNCNSLGPMFKCRNLLGTYRCDPVRPTKPPFRSPPLSPARTTTRPSYTTTTTTTTTTPSTKVFFPTIYHVPTTTETILPSYKEKHTYIIPAYYPLINAIPSRDPFANNYYNANPIVTQHKNCLPGYRMSSSGLCEDINECESNPCGPGQKCINHNGRYECSVGLICIAGFEINEDGSKCVDVNECIRGSHNCDPSQICKNRIGFFTCECPVGYHLDVISKRCVDTDECRQYRPCGSQSVCENTPGSYRCVCQAGFIQKGYMCDDIDECRATPGLCDQKCVNLWGSYRCACAAGYQLASDNRTCVDVDECVKFGSSGICVHQCRNMPGSYVCECPRGYRLANDRRACIDINECEQNICNPHATCVNYAGGHKCFSIKCPEGYVRDPNHESICKRSGSLCDPRSNSCLLKPEQYTYQFITINSDLPLTDGPIQLFQISGPKYTQAKAEFKMTLLDVNCPPEIERVTEYFFRRELNGTNSMQLFLTKAPRGPQEVKLQIEMMLYSNLVIIGKVVVYIIVIVSEYSF